MSSEADLTPKPEGVYWPLTKGADLGAQVRSRYLEYLKALDERKLIASWRHLASVYYGFDPATGSLSDWVTTAGEQGQFMNLHVNEFASLVRHQLILMTAEKIDFDCMPTSDSPQAEAQAALGEQVIRYYQSEGKVDATLNQGAERMLLFGGGYITQLWDAYKGPEAGVEDVPRYGGDGEPMTEKVEVEVPPDPMEMPEPGVPQMGMQQRSQEPRYEVVERPMMDQRVKRGGDIVHRVYSPLDIARDLGARTHDDNGWFIVRERHDRYELAAKFPEHRAVIMERPPYDRDETIRYETGGRSTFSMLSKTDQIHVLRLVHDRCESVPNGMEALVVGDTVLMPPQDLSYARVPIHPMVASEHLDTAIGHTTNIDLLGPQSALNAAAIGGLTAMDAGSRPVWAVPKGSKVSVEDLTRGVVSYEANPQMPDGGMPKLLEMPTLNDTHLKGMELWTQKMQSLSGINAVARGESQGKSGADNALLQAQAVQYQSGNVRALAQCARSVGLGIIEILQRFATTERLVRIVGEDESPSLTYFTGADLSDIRHVDVDLGDPAMRTMARRKEVASELVERFPNQVTVEQYLAFLSSGRLEPLFKAQRNQIRLIRAENSALAKGEQVRALVADSHLDHLKEHLSLLSSPALRADPALVESVLAHCQEHEMLWAEMGMRPALIAATGQSPAPPPMGGPMPPPGAGGPGGPPQGPQDQQGPPPAERAQLAGAPDEVGGVKMPAMPDGVAADGQPMNGGMQ